jgi:hypothetical protein
MPSTTEVITVSGGVRSVPEFPVNCGVELEAVGPVLCTGKLSDEFAGRILVIADGGTSRGGEPDCCVLGPIGFDDGPEGAVVDGSGDNWFNWLVGPDCSGGLGEVYVGGDCCIDIGG